MAIICKLIAARSWPSTMYLSDKRSCQDAFKMLLTSRTAFRSSELTRRFSLKALRTLAFSDRTLLRAPQRSHQLTIFSRKAAECKHLIGHSAHLFWLIA